MKKITLDLPLIVNGKLRFPREVPDDQIQILNYESGLKIRLPKLLETDVDEIEKQAAEISSELRKLTTADIITFLGEVGERWDARKLAGRQLVRKYAHLVTQFSDIMMERDYETMGHFLLQRWHLYDEIESQFGEQRIFDEWIPVQMSYRKAFPRGLVLHYLVGNLPLASMYSMVRGVATKNRTLAKLPSRDPISPIGLAQAIIEVDPNHPISRSLSLAYWPHNDVTGDRCIGMVDAACVWGGAEAVEAVKKKLPANVPLAEFGPKWSASAIDLTQCDINQAAMRVIEDSSFYDQEACFNTQRAYVKGDIEPFIEALKKAFVVFNKNLPFVSTNRDILAHRSITLLEAKYQGFRVESGDDWAVVVLPLNEHGFRHPLGRTLYIHQLDDLGKITDYLTRDSQTLSVYPWKLIETYRDEWAGAGTDRMVELGFSRMPRAGFTHDAMLSMHTFVRLVSIERPWSDSGRYYTRRNDPGTHYLVDRYDSVRRTMDKDDLGSYDEEQISELNASQNARLN
ncbi:acyl-CoA reductase [Leptospira weilii]|uniref:acyl-CoA reductase n=1 Tax=Leptospira weilii TaxID=28184 RepID=UPI000774D3A2|nr:acyl-CoA reductase [Leptospira weilii]